MPSPTPKHPSVRARRNKTSTAATLAKPATARVVPPLPPIVDPETGDMRTWLPMTESWWADVWASPMAPEYDDSDIHGLYVLAALVNGYWMNPSTALAAEIRLQRQCFGLTPMDRRRLQWEIERTDEAQDKGSRRRATARPAPPPAGKSDPRAFLKAI